MIWNQICFSWPATEAAQQLSAAKTKLDTYFNGPFMIASAVVTLDTTAFEAATLVAQIDCDVAIELGELSGCRLPITIEANDPAALESLTRRVGEIEGVQFVDVVFVSLEDTDDATSEAGPAESSHANQTQPSSQT